MHLLTTHLTLLASTITLALSAALTSTFALNAVVLSTQHRTPLAVELSESSIAHPARATGPPTRRANTTPAASRFSLRGPRAASSGNGEYGPLGRRCAPNASITFRGLRTRRRTGSSPCRRAEGGDVFRLWGWRGGGGLLDGWSLCATEAAVAFYWSGTQGALDGCVKVALERQ
ncbi:hypothetical protein GGS24DRAFT_167009 [Hypoxylon argillaceum]|nr:hypothetical protein GGS24DRAFT_167009 [Hypoxylon argillaceum]